MKIKNVLVVVTALLALGFGMHRGLTQAPPIIVGPGLAPNVGTPANPRSLDYYGGYYGGNNDEAMYNSGANLYNVTFGPTDIPQTSARITTKMTTSAVSFAWEGEPRAVQSITFTLLDKNNAAVTKQVITRLPARATLKKTAKATGYSVSVLYINGLSNTIVSPL